MQNKVIVGDKAYIYEDEMWCLYNAYTRHFIRFASEAEVERTYILKIKLERQREVQIARQQNMPQGMPYYPQPRKRKKFFGIL